MPDYLPRCEVLDCFTRTGTTLAEDKKLGRRSIGIEMVPDYVKLAVRRITAVSLPLTGML